MEIKDLALKWQLMTVLTKQKKSKAAKESILALGASSRIAPLESVKKYTVR